MRVLVHRLTGAGLIGLVGAAFGVVVVACSGTSPGDGSVGPGASVDSGLGTPDGSQPAQDSGVTGDGSPAPDSGTTPDASHPPPIDASIPPDPGDGTPTRQQCTGNFGSGLSSSHGRLDGLLVAIVPVGGSHTCNGDSSHVHLQILMGNAVYDVAVNTDTLIAERDIDLPDGAWSDGWHTSDGLDYVSLGLHSGDFTMPSSPSALAQRIETELANANHISVFATGYSSAGAHLVHRQGTGRDGAIVIHPLASPAHVLMFSFTTSSPF